MAKKSGSRAAQAGRRKDGPPAPPKPEVTGGRADLLKKMDAVTALAATRPEVMRKMGGSYGTLTSGTPDTLAAGTPGTLTFGSMGTLSSGSWGTLSSGSFGTLADDSADAAASVRLADPKSLPLLSGGLLAAGESLDADKRVRVVVDCGDSEKRHKVMKALGDAAKKLTATKIVASVSPDELFPLAEKKDVGRIEASLPMPPKLNIAHDKTGLTAGQGAGKRQTDLTGRGVLVGVVDTGIDGSHPDFFAGTRSRIVDFLDQTPGNTPHFDALPGKYLAAADARKCTDENGHGTHVAGIAAGGGGGDSAYMGVAPEADLAIVKTSFQSTDIALAIAHIFDVASKRQQPCVVNLSLGGHWGGHDGSSLTERVIDELCDAPGRVVVAAAGNEGADRTHASAMLRELPPGDGDKRRWVADLEVLQRVAEGHLVGSALVQIWTQREDDVSVTLRTPLGERVAPPVENIARHANAFYAIDAMHEVSPISGDHATTFSFAVRPTSRLLEGWSVIVEEKAKGSAPVGAAHAWIVDGGGRFTNGYVRSHLVGMPATAFSAIAVASFGTHGDWPQANGAAGAFAPDVQADDISYFSSRGPTRDGYTKPEIAAPGQWVVSTLSAQARPHLNQNLQLPGGLYAAMQGTSMASPYVAGAVALLLQKEPNLTWAEIKRRLMKSAGQDGFSRSCWNAAWGYGKLNVKRLLEANP